MSFHEPKPIANVVGWVGDTPPPATASRDMAILDALHCAYRALDLTRDKVAEGMTQAERYFYDMAREKHGLSPEFLLEREKAQTKLKSASAALKAHPFDGLDEASSGLPF
jgi:hypothetical protein